MTTGVERFISDAAREINLDDYYVPYPQQAAFHCSPARHRLLGGAAGPGKTLALIMDHLVACNEFSDPLEAAQVHTLLLRRIERKLRSTLITRFLEKVPRELYRDYNDSKKIVTWLNGATTHFGSMQYEHDVMGWQGQWYKIGYDELTEFTFRQWNGISAWNRCPVSPYSTKDGATNPIGIGAAWVERLFVLHKPCEEMDKAQRAQYHPADYEYFPCTYQDNPVYAHDAIYIANLDSYQAAISEALKHGKWGIAGGYFQGAWDEAANVYDQPVEIKPWWPKWLGGDWGFEHNSAIYWMAMDEHGIVRVFDELVVNHHTPEELGEAIVAKSVGADGKYYKLDLFSFSHDAFAQRQDAQSIGARVSRVLRQAGLCGATSSTKDKPGREQILYDFLKGRVKLGEVYDDEKHATVPVEVAKLQIWHECQGLINAIKLAPRDEDNSEEIAEFLGDDPLQGAGYALYAKFGRPAVKPKGVLLAERLSKISDPTSRHVEHLKLEAKWKQGSKPIQRQGDWRSKMEGQ